LLAVLSFIRTLLALLGYLLDKAHWFSAADQRAFSSSHDLDFVATDAAQIDFSNLGHMFTSLH
jgi:hypothetical protein